MGLDITYVHKLHKCITCIRIQAILGQEVAGKGPESVDFRHHMSSPSIGPPKKKQVIK